MRVDFDDVEDDSTGVGRTRLWRNVDGVMTLIMDITAEKTLNTSTSECDRVHLFTYWNWDPAGGQGDQLCYFDRFIVVTDLGDMTETDAGGTPIIGGLI